MIGPLEGPLRAEGSSGTGTKSKRECIDFIELDIDSVAGHDKRV